MTALAYAHQPDDQPEPPPATVSALHTRYPSAYAPDDASGYVTLDKDLLAMFYGATGGLTDRQLRLLVAIAGDPSWVDVLAGRRVEWSVARLAAVTGLRCDHIVPALTSAPLGLPANPNTGERAPDDGPNVILDVNASEYASKGRWVWVSLRASDYGLCARTMTSPTIAGKRRQSAPITSELLRFLFERLGRVQVRLVLRLLAALDFDGGTTATLSDERLWMDGVVQQQRCLKREIDDPDFRALVTVTRGTPDTVGRKGITTSYDLAPLLRAFAKNRRAA